MGDERTAGHAIVAEQAARDWLRSLFASFESERADLDALLSWRTRRRLHTTERFRYRAWS